MRKTIKKFFPFPELINDVAARFVGAGVLFMSLCSIILITADNNIMYFTLGSLCYGLFARVCFGATISPLALIVTKIIVPKTHFNEKYVPGPPKRFAQLIGFIISFLTIASILLGNPYIAVLLLAVLSIFAFLESALGYCFACKVFKLLMKAGLIPESACQLCASYDF